MKKGRKPFISTKLKKKKKPITYPGLSKGGILNTTSRGKCRHTATMDGGHLVTDTGFGNGLFSESSCECFQKRETLNS